MGKKHPPIQFQDIKKALEELVASDATMHRQAAGSIRAQGNSQIMQSHVSAHNLYVAQVNQIGRAISEHLGYSYQEIKPKYRG